MAQREEALNAALAALLADRGVQTEAEALRGPRGAAPDVLAHIAGEVVVIEAKKLQNTRSATRWRIAYEAAVQAEERIAAGIADSGVVLAYPPGVTTATLEQHSDLRWWSVTGSGSAGSSGGVRVGPEVAGGVDYLARWLMGVPGGDVDDAADRLLAALNDAAGRLGGAARIRLCETLGLPASKPAHERAGTIRGLLTIAAASMFHRRLTGYLQTMAPPGGSGSPRESGSAVPPERWPPIDPFNAVGHEDPVRELHDAWTAIVRIDYRPVFESAIAVLEAMASTGNEFTAAVRVVVRAADSVSRTAAGSRHDLLGRIFHKVLDTARYDGSFYTSTAAAVLLASLALRPETIDWSDIEAVAGLRVCDPACGSGTLLMAAAERIQELMADAGAGPEQRGLASEALIERVLWGYDINLVACHLAATTLGLLAPSVEFKRMNIFRAPLGVSGRTGSKGDVRLGSIDLLRPFINDNGTRVSFPGFLPDPAAHIDDTARASEPPPMDLVVMNPPFTRDSLRHDQFSRREEKKIKDAEKRLLDRHPDRTAARLHSSDGPFLLLGEHLTRERGGIIAMVLPAVVATSPGALGRRRFLADKFHVDWVVTSHDPERWFFSDNTAIREMLIVGRRRNGNAASSLTRFVNLTRNPASPADASVVAEMIAHTESADRAHAEFTVHAEDAETVAVGDWRAAAFLSPYLLQAFRSLAEKCEPLSAFAEVGPAGRRIRDAFFRYNMSKCRNPREIMWDHKADIRTSMAAQPDSWADMRPAKLELAKSYWEQRSRLLLAARLRLNTMRVTTVRTEWPTVGSAWVPVRPRDGDPATEKAVCVWLNSTPGLLGVYGQRTLKAFSYPRFALEDQRSLPIPSLSGAQKSALAEAYDRQADATLLPFSSMGECETRAALDVAVVDALGDELGITRETVRRLRSLLAAEPSVCALRPCS